jgi:hypothetical protein
MSHTGFLNAFPRKHPAWTHSSSQEAAFTRSVTVTCL